MAYHIVWEKEGIYIRFGGSATAREVLAIDDLMYAHPSFDLFKYQIFDFTDIEYFRFTEEDMKVIGSLDRSASRWNRIMKVAIISTSESFLETLEHYEAQTYGSPWITRVFSSLDEAREWVMDS